MISKAEKRGVVYALVICVWMAWLCSILIVSQCNFMTTVITTTQYKDIFSDFTNVNNKNNDNNNNDDDDNIDTELIRTVQQTYGLFSRPYYHSDDSDNNNNNNNNASSFLGCIRYSQSERTTMGKDTKFRTGQAFGLITILLLTASTIISFGLIFLNFSFDRVNTENNDPRRLLSRVVLWKIAHYLLIAASITQLFTFIALGSKDKCHHNYGNDDNDDIQNDYTSGTGGCNISSSAKLAIFNVVLLDVLGLLWFFVILPDTPLLHVRLYNNLTNNFGANGNDDQNQSIIIDDTPEDQQDNNIQQNDSITIINVKQSLEEDEGQNYQNDTDSIISECTNDNDHWTKTDSVSIEDTMVKSYSRYFIIQRYQLQYRLITVLMITIVWIVSILGVNRCTMVETIMETTNVDDTYNDDDDNNISHHDQQNRSGIGLYQMAIHDENQIILGCVSYPSHMIQDTLDSAFRMARTFGAFTTLITSAIFVLSILQLFRVESVRKISLTYRSLLLLAIISEASTFTIFRSDICNIDGTITCQLGGTGRLVILNILLLGVLSVLVTISPTPKEPLMELVPTIDNGMNITSFFSSVSTKTIWEALSNFKLNHTSELTQNEKSTNDSELSTNDKGTLDVQMNLNDENDMNVTSVVVEVEQIDNRKTTRKIITYQDGTQMIHTTIEETYEVEEEIDDFEVDDNRGYLE